MVKREEGSEIQKSEMRIVREEGNSTTGREARVLTSWPTTGTPILVPLTPSLYVPGKLASTDVVLVDIGTGFYVEKVCHLIKEYVGRGVELISKKIQTPPAAREFYSRKVEELGKNLLDLEKIVQGKQGNLSVVEDGECTVVTSWS